MNLGELETVTTYDLPIKVVVLNNFGDGMVRQWQKLFFKGRHSASDKSLHKKDFVKAAQADGFRVRRAARPQGRRAARGGGVRRVQGPGVPRGDDRHRGRRLPDGRARARSYDEMITGDFIASRGKQGAGEADASEMF